MSSAAPQRPPWLFGPRSDLLIGCGLLYALAFALSLSYGRQIRSAQPELVAQLVGLLIGTPHYGATLLRVYEERGERRRYAVFTLWATLAVLAVFAAGLWVVAIGSFLFTLYLSWSPWHYSGQNYGLAVMFLRRSGFELEARAKRWLYLSYLFSFLLVLTGIHRAVPGAEAASAGYAPSSAQFQPLGIPAADATVLGGCFLALSLFFLVRAGIALRRAPRRALLAAGLLSLSQLLWFSLPFGVHVLALVTDLDPLDFRFRPHYFVWIGAAHSAQYLWVTAYFARQSGPWPGQLGNYGRVLLAGSAAFAVPTLLFGTRAFGPIAFDRGLANIVEAAVNVHHFILDGAIWKLRGRIAEILVRRKADVADAGLRPRSAALRRLVWGVCAAALAASLFGTAGNALLTLDARSGRFGRAALLADALAWLGRDRVGVRAAFAQLLLQAQRFDEARAQLLQAEALEPSAALRQLIGVCYERQGEYRLAAEAYGAAAEMGGIAPAGRAVALRKAGLSWLAAGAPHEAIGLFERARAADPATAQETEALIARAQQALAAARARSFERR